MPTAPGDVPREDVNVTQSGYLWLRRNIRVIKDDPETDDYTYPT